MRSVLLACLLAFAGVLPAQGAKVLWFPFDHDENPPDPGFGGYSGHTGSDYRCPEGTNIYAAIGGTVVTAIGDIPGQVCDFPNYGNYVKIQNNDHQLQVLEAHLLQGSVIVYGGQTVVAGQYIGKSSNSGYTLARNEDGEYECGIGSAYHLHFEVRALIDDVWTAVDPYTHAGGLWTEPLLYGNDTPPPPPQPTFVCSYVSKSIAPAGPYTPGQGIQCEIRFKNEGTGTWLPAPGPQYVELASCNGAEVIGESFFNYPYDSGLGWKNHYVPDTFIQNDTHPGETATFQFAGRIRSDATPGPHDVYFGPCFNGAIMPGWGQAHFTVTVENPPPPPPPPPSAPAFTEFTGRFNDDAYSDVCLYDEVPGSWYVSCRDPSANRFIANASPWLTGFGINGGYTALAGDIGGSELDDVCLLKPSVGRWFVAYSAGDHFSIAIGTGGPESSWLDDWGKESAGTYTPFLADCNNDGYLDVVLYEAVSGSWYVALRDLSQNRFIPQPSPWLTGFGDGVGLYTPLVGNFCGDGRYDIALYAHSSGNWYVAQNTGSGFTRSATNPWITGFGNGGAYQVRTGQLRGDVLTDVILIDTANGRWFVAQSTGSAFTKLNGPEVYGAWITGYGDAGYRPLTGFFSWDSFLDIGLYEPTLGRWFVATNDGNPDRFTRTDGPYTAGSWLDGWGTEPSSKMLPPETPDIHEPLIPLPEPPVVPLAFTLSPNPLPPGATLHLTLPAGSRSVTVTDVAGRVVFTSPIRTPGLTWNGPDASGNCLSSGIYFVRLTGPTSGRTTQKLVVLR